MRRRFDAIYGLMALLGCEPLAPGFDEVRVSSLPRIEEALGLPLGSLHISRFSSGVFFGLTDGEVLGTLIQEREQGALISDIVISQPEDTPREQIIGLTRRVNVSVREILCLTLNDQLKFELERVGLLVKSPSRQPGGFHLGMLKVFILDCSNGMMHKHSMQWTSELSHYKAATFRRLEIRNASLTRIAVELLAIESDLRTIWGARSAL
jgi:hypothetical protein